MEEVEAALRTGAASINQLEKKKRKQKQPRINDGVQMNKICNKSICTPKITTTLDSARVKGRVDNMSYGFFLIKLKFQ